MLAVSAFQKSRCAAVFVLYHAFEIMKEIRYVPFGSKR